MADIRFASTITKGCAMGATLGKHVGRAPVTVIGESPDDKSIGAMTFRAAKNPADGLIVDGPNGDSFILTPRQWIGFRLAFENATRAVGDNYGNKR